MENLRAGFHECGDNVSQWIEDTIFATILKKHSEHNSVGSDLLFLFRLLAILYRVRYPIDGKNIDHKIDSNILVVLESKICNAGLVYLEKPSLDKETRRKK